MSRAAHPKGTHAHEAWERLDEAQRDELAAIARNTMRLSTLETRGSDRLDFGDVAVWSVRDALARAYLAGRTRKRRT